MFETVRCPLCKQGHAVLEEEKMGLASLLILKCSSSKCKFEKLFYTFNKVVNSQAFEVNRRVVLATRNIGVGHQGLVKFCGVMNMLPPYLCMLLGLYLCYSGRVTKLSILKIEETKFQKFL